MSLTPTRDRQTCCNKRPRQTSLANPTKHTAGKTISGRVKRYRLSYNLEGPALTVDLDLRKATAGAYFLSTTHEQDQAVCYNPLQIK